MQVLIDYDSAHNEAVITNIDTRADLWEELARKLREVYPAESVTGENRVFRMPWRSFLRANKTIKTKCVLNGVKLSLSPEAVNGLSSASTVSYRQSLSIEPVSESELKAKLSGAGFTRASVLTRNQIRNLMKIANLPSAATFSVPGAGKTTEALAFFFFNAKAEDRLLVVAPKSALISWDNELHACAANCPEHFVRLQGGIDNIRRQLSLKPRFAIISYQQFPRVEKEITDYLNRNKVFMFLDESHRIKAGMGGMSARAILNVSNLPERKLVMSGTPMPQATSDLIPQFTFLYPEEHASEEQVVNMFQPIFVRTTADQLGIPSIKFIKKPVRMNELQRKVYKSIKETTARELETFHITDFSRDNLRRIGKSVMKVLQFVSNPSLLASEISFAYSPEMARVLCEGDGPKLSSALRLAREIVSQPGEKVIIWSTFVRNVQLIALRLQDLGANYIDGTVPTGDALDPTTREYRINAFLTNPNCKVLVANPAACSESISLHTACHNAVYLDRSFNAAHFMQSEDRIHRLGLKETPNVYIVECEDTVDQVVDERLQKKIENMSRALNDPSIIISNFETNPENEDDDEGLLEESEGIDTSDAQALLRYFFGEQ